MCVGQARPGGPACVCVGGGGVEGVNMSASRGVQGAVMLTLPAGKRPFTKAGPLTHRGRQQVSQRLRRVRACVKEGESERVWGGGVGGGVRVCVCDGEGVCMCSGKNSLEPSTFQTCVQGGIP